MTPKELREAVQEAILKNAIRSDDPYASTDAALAAIRAREAEVGRLREALVRLCAWGRMTPSTPDERSAEQREGWGAFDQARAALATPAPEDAA